MRMPFGKYRDVDFEDIPEDYFEWLLDQDWLKDSLRNKIEEFLGETPSSRSSSSRPASVSPLRPEDVPCAAAIVREGYRALVKKNHPDVGGDTKRMAELNRVNEALKRLLGVP